MTVAGIHLGAAPASSASSNDLCNQFGPLPREERPLRANSGSYVKVDNPMPHRLPEGENAAPLEVIGTTASDKLVIIMVGLPATGKTHIAKRICRFLSFFHDIPAQIFNVGDYRRELFGAKMSANFYHPTNADGAASRAIACDAALKDLIDYMQKDGVRVAAFDATNSTKERRKHVMTKIKQAGLGCKRMFVESICDQEGLLEENIRKVKLSTPDYRDMDPTMAIADFKQRRENYKKVYEPVDEEDGPHIKMINSKQFHVCNIRGYLPLKVVHFVMNLHTLPRTFYLTRHGQSEYNLLGKIGGDSGLSAAGTEYARRLALFAKKYVAQPNPRDSMANLHNLDASSANNTSEDDSDEGASDESSSPPSNHASSVTSGGSGMKTNRPLGPKERPARLWTSTLRRTKETAQFIQHNAINHTYGHHDGENMSWLQFRPMARRNLDELYAGTCDGMTYKEIEQVYPDEFQRRQADKLAYRYPRGESYMDVTLRLEPLAQEMERTREPVLIIAHQGILRILYAYFMGLDRKEAPYVSIPLNNVIELSPHAYGCQEKRFCLMDKEEMLTDGQDEPVTSMPRMKKRVSIEGTTAQVVVNTHYQSDPVMNAPSC